MKPGTEALRTKEWGQRNGNSCLPFPCPHSFVIILIFWISTAQGAEKISFNRDIQPILSEHCFACHGRDEAHRKAGLRLDERSLATHRLESGATAIVPGKPEASELIARITSSDEDEQMPPRKQPKRLTAAQIELLRQWIAQGAEYEMHWAFIAPKRPIADCGLRIAELAKRDPVRGEKLGHWPQNLIDHFVLDRLLAEGLEPSPEADAHALIRRATFDLTGLPPSAEEISAFVNGTNEKNGTHGNDPSHSSHQSYEALLDRLLQSPRFGEHRARYWLDAARYADTTGLHRDNFRLSWPYRDYVIAAFNANTPFDQFTIEQLAGDLIPADSFAPLVATGFNRLHITTSESGEITEMLQVQNVTDRVNTVSALFLGLTSSCAACHDHKFDPISQKEFYALGAFFNNSQDPPFDDEESAFFPTITLPKDDQRDAATALLKQRSDVQAKLGARRARSDLLEAWLAAPTARAVSGNRLVARFRFDEGKGDIVRNSAPGAQPAEYKAAVLTPHWGELLKHWPSMRLAAPTELRLGQLGDFDTGDAFTVAGWFKPRVGRGTKKGTLIAKTAMGEGNRGWEMFWDDGTTPDFPKLRRWPDGRLMINLVHDGANAISVRAAKVISRIEWSHLAFSYDGSGKAAGLRLFINGEPQPVEVMRDRLQGSIRTGVPLQLSHRTNGTGKNVEASPLVETAFQDLRIYARRLDDDEVRRTVDEDFVAELLTRPRERWSTNDRHTLSTFYFDHMDREAVALREQLARLDAKLDEATKGGVRAFVMREHDQLPMAHVLERGEYQRLKQRVLADVPAFLPPLPAGTKHDRLAFARWLVSPEHPLMARVTVNRMWQEIFGTGLVSTPGDFGTVGARPSDAALLDWLAVDFRESGWDVKRFYKQVLMSATYRQSARATPALIERDPANRLLARGPRFRLDGEMIRDSALAAGGLLREQIGGPAVNIYQPPNLWEIMSMDGSNTRTHVPGMGDALYRRSLYTFWKRTAAPPVFTTFDAPARESCIIQRERTDTPLQALAALNAPDFLEAARHLAARAMHAAQGDARMDFMAARVITRPLGESDRAVLRGTFEKMRGEFTEQEARDYLTVGDSKPDPTLPVIELAAWSVVASQLMNTDAALNK